MYMLIMVLDEVAYLNQVLEAWIDSGVQGVTILESTGLGRTLAQAGSMRMFAGFSQMFAGGTVGHNTLFAVIDNLDIAEAAVKATQKILGDLSQPHTGIIFAVPVAKVWGKPEPYPPLESTKP